mmetsp:Transcript_8505/g.30585  ORF Transcript_8505/g.30585 Transcript_8505/m.30585 type:complete len:394 (+) Transcript_8505:70-1251(+)
MPVLSGKPCQQLPRVEADVAPSAGESSDEVFPHAPAPRFGRLRAAAKVLAGCTAAALVVAASLDLISANALSISKTGRLRGKQELFAAAGGSLFCFCIARTDGYELEILETQSELRAGLFSCDDQMVFSDKQVQISDNFYTTEVGQLSAPLGGGGGPLATGSWVNTQPFFHAWGALRQDGRYLDYDYTIKVDPDTVFFPAMFRQRLPMQGPGARVFFNNCPNVGNGFYGSLEIMSNGAIAAFLNAMDQCQIQLPFQQGWGEDLFCQKCMESAGAVGQPGYDLMADGNCQGAGGPPQCTPGKAAYHPLKSSGAWEACWNQAGSAPTGFAPGMPQQGPPYEGQPAPGAQIGGGAMGYAPGMQKHRFPVEELQQPDDAPSGGGLFSALPGFHRLKK